MHVIVIGAGVVGAAVATALARRGADVTVLDAGRPGAGTTTTSFAWVNANNKDPLPYFELNNAGVAAHHALAGGPTPWFFPTGHLEWATTDEHATQLAARVAKLEGRGYPVRRLTRAEALALEPDLVAPADAEFVFYPQEAHTLPGLLHARLLGEARDRGATVVPHTEVTGIDLGAPAVTTASGDEHGADVIVSCAGRWSTSVAALAGLDVPLLDPDLAGSATVGFLATTEPVPARLSRILTHSRLNVRPDGGGRLLLQALDLDGAADPAAPPPADGPLAAEITGRLPDVLALTGGTRLEKIRVGQRPLPADGLTIAGFADPDRRFYAVATHSGITLAPLLGDLVTDELFGAESPLLAAFRPTRFARGATEVTPTAARRPGEQ
ncbi:glycine/D-amino acid oxidase-like deaminating enzyme [Pseudonocardia hierapolitana]|uniref:Glycine/D-amino acid oxidase-like deaminating enzyme n=1 Tax=Pseudonocardia hierapolitana TaxID=1128676 RepID=A0A561SYG8_9PSEU|nr:FAD-binding oxidoreductase [Pseudonocardia hierapolitana]TWF79882.1 glycine/D-amino acid oxidase-like deaminating enzyme [Pseudonocardia hierapolitana]